jgi:hypothetical protein
MKSKLGKYAAWIAGGLALVSALLMLRPPGQVRGMDGSPAFRCWRAVG